MDYDRTPPPAISTGLRCRCPRCARGRLFAGYLTLRQACGLDFAFADSGDGPAFFVMTIVGFIVVAAAMWLEFTYEPPMWVHLSVAIPLTLGLSLALVRPAKGIMIALQYQHRAAEGRLQR